MRKIKKKNAQILPVACSLLVCLPSASSLAADAPAPESSMEPTKQIPNDPSLFRPDPNYADKAYDPDAQIGIYGDKRAVISTRPMLELGRELYKEGPFSPAPDYLGAKNLIIQRLYAYGDWRNAVGVNYNGSGAKTHAIAATRLDLDLDYQFTATERFHAFFRPFESGAGITSVNFLNQTTKGHAFFDGTPLAGFFEGDAARLLEGFSGKNNNVDLPVAAGLMPMVVQNGVWMQSAFLGGAFTIPARNSSFFKISNMDVTFFAGLDDVNTAAVKNAQGGFASHNAKLFGVSTFIEANQGYWEADYGYTAVDNHFRGFDYHNLSLAFTHRYFDRISDSIRAIWNFGQQPLGGKAKTADGLLLLMENSFVTREELTLLPYANFFVGINTPQSLARDGGAGGVLVNTGLNFETDGLTAFPKLDDTGHDTYGGALGIEYLFNLNQQIVLELATVQVLDNAVTAGRTAVGSQYALGARYQIPLSRSWIFRTDGIIADREHTTDIAGIRFELRYKF